MKWNTETDVFKYSYVDDFLSWIRIHSVETITSVFLHIPFVFATYYLTDMIMSWYANGFHITAPFVKEFHNTLVDSPHKWSVMQSFSVSFVVNLNKLLNQQFSWWWFQRLCHCKVKHLCHMILQNIFFCYFVYLSVWMHTHVTKPTFSFSISFLIDFNSCCIFNCVWSLMFSHLVCWTKWQATGLDAWASRVKCPARFVSHLHEICIYTYELFIAFVSFVVCSLL